MKFDRIVPTKNKSKGVNTCEYIVLHHTGGGSYEGNIKTLSVSTGDSAVSCHYVVSQDGKVAKIGDHSDILRHCGDSAREGRKGMNAYCIGIEIINVGTSFTDQQRQAVRELVLHIMDLHGIPASRIIRHKDIAPKRKVDVYDTFRSNGFASFKDYQKSFEKKEGEEHLRSIMAMNSKAYGTAKSAEYQNLLKGINNLCRDYFGEEKK